MMDEYITKQDARAALLQGPWKPNEWHVINILITSIPPADVRPAAEILNAVDEAIIFLNNASHQMPYHVYSALYDLIYEICPNCGADMMGGDADGDEED